jgi:hypothetical protein
MNSNKLYIDSYYKTKIQADANACSFSLKNKQQYYHIIPCSDGRFKVSRYYDKHSIGCYYHGIFKKV